MANRAFGIVLLVALLFVVYTLTSAGKFHIVDEVSLFSVTEALAQRGAVDTNAIAWTQWVNSPGEVLGAFGPDGQVYSKKGPAPAFVAVPWYLLLRTIAQLEIGIGLVQGTLLWNGVITALTAALLWLTALRLGYSDRVGLLLGLLFGLCTIAWPYANHFFGEPLSALSLLLCFYAIRTFRTTEKVRWLWLAGVAAGVAIATVVAHTLLIAVLGLYWLTFFFYGSTSTGQRSPRLLRALGAGVAFGVPIIITGLLLLWYNQVRFGNPFETGYHFTSGEGFTNPLSTGLWGLLISPYRGLFWHTPLFIASLCCFWPFLRRHVVEAVVIFGLSFVLISLYSRWWMWWGGFAWGPRFLVPLTPLWVLLLAEGIAQIEARLGVLEEGTTWARWRAVGGMGVLLAVSALLSLAVQLLAVTVNYVNYEIQLRTIFDTDWLDPLRYGPPAQSLADWFYSPVLGQWQLLTENFAGNEDLSWILPTGAVNWLTLLIGLAAIVTLGLLLFNTLTDTEDTQPSVLMFGVAPLIVLTVMGVTLGQSASDPHYGIAGEGYRAVLTEICKEAKPTDAIVTVAPFAYQIPMNWLGSACHIDPPIYGYGVESATQPQAAAVLTTLLETRERIWLVTGGLPANDPENTIEQWLVGAAYEADDRWFGDYRLVRYATPVRLRSAATNQLGIPLSRTQFPEVTLLTASAPEAATSTAIVPVALEYQLDQPVDADLHWFVQLLSTDGYAVALVDTTPANGYTSFRNLPVGETQVEHVALQLPANLIPGRYRLIAGLYDPSTTAGQRLRLPNGRDFVDLGVITILE